MSGEQMSMVRLKLVLSYVGHLAVFSRSLINNGLLRYSGTSSLQVAVRFRAATSLVFTCWFLTAVSLCSLQQRRQRQRRGQTQVVAVHLEHEDHLVQGPQRDHVRN